MSDDDFLSRWSRRKRKVAEDEAVEAVLQPAPEPEVEIEAEAEDEEVLLARLDLPAPESLKPGDDFSAFMADGVPHFLRKRALRVLWRSNPVLANLDGLNDYDEDFTSPELTQKVLATAYQVGRGFVSQVTQPEETEGDEPEPVEDETPAPEPQPGANSPVNQGPADTVAYDEEAEPAPRPRRMRFRS